MYNHFCWFVARAKLFMVLLLRWYQTDFSETIYESETNEISKYLQNLNKQIFDGLKEIDI